MSVSGAPSPVSFNLLVLRAEDPERLRAFYSALGLRFVCEQHDSGPVHHASELNGWVFEIYPRAPDEPSTAGTRLGFTVPSLDGALLVLTGCHGAIISGPTTTRLGRKAVVCDPEGHRVELIQPIATAA